MRLPPARSCLRALAVSLLVIIAPAAAAATLPSGFQESMVATGLSSPTAMALASDGRVFVCQRDRRKLGCP
jgi:hypothetical protein